MSERRELKRDNLAERNIFGIDFTGIGTDLPIHCPDCRRLLTVIKLNERCTVDIDVECAICGGKAVGSNLRAEIVGKV